MLIESRTINFDNRSTTFVPYYKAANLNKKYKLQQIDIDMSLAFKIRELN